MSGGTRDWLHVGCEAGHDWQFVGGCNCGCDEGDCSVPVYACTRCGDCDYGENEEATEKRQKCQEEEMMTSQGEVP
jgi:hypothetical protein